MMMNLMMRLWKDEEGQGLVEYALILVLISLAAILIMPSVGDAIRGIFVDAESALN